MAQKSIQDFFKKKSQIFCVNFSPIFFVSPVPYRDANSSPQGPTSIGQGQELLHGLLRRWRFGVEETFAVDFPTEKNDNDNDNVFLS